MATNKFITNILPTIAPRLPAAPDEYDKRFIEQYSNILRIYFNGIDTTFGGLLGQTRPGSPLHSGGAYLTFPYASVSRTTDLTFTANTPTRVTFDTNLYLNDCTYSAGAITVNNAGLYNLQFKLQMVNTDNTIHTAYVWVRVNGVDKAGSGNKIDVTAHHGSTDGYVLVSGNFFISLNAGDNISLYVAVDNAQVYIEAYAANSPGFSTPSIPSALMSLTFVSLVPS